MAGQRIRIYKEARRLNLWFLMIPFVMLIAFIGFFLLKHTSRSTTATASPGVTSSLLPELGEVRFDASQPTLTTDGQATLDRAAEAMHGNPNVHLRLEGYADLPKRAPRKPSLAQQRTLAVGRYLEAHGIDPTRLTGGSLSAPTLSSPSSLDPGTDSRRVELFVH